MSFDGPITFTLDLTASWAGFDDDEKKDAIKDDYDAGEEGGESEVAEDSDPEITVGELEDPPNKNLLKDIS